MQSEAIKSIFLEQVYRSESFDNYHGITTDKVMKFTVEPFPVTVEPDDLETEEREMWVVLDPPGGYLVAFDPLYEVWAVIEQTEKTKFIQVISGEALAEALHGM